MSEKNAENKNLEKNYVRNYIILGIIFIFSFLLTAYFCNMYRVYKDYQKEVPIIRGTLMEITDSDLDHLVVDNSSVVIYMCYPSDDECRSFEKKLKKYVQKREITDEILYLNLFGTDKDIFVKSFNEKYRFKTKLSSHFPAFVSFDDGKVTSILQEKKNDTLSISKLHNYLELVWQDDEESVDDSSSDEAGDA